METDGNIMDRDTGGNGPMVTSVAVVERETAVAAIVAATATRTIVDVRNINRTRLATECGWSRTYISRILQGKRCPSLRRARIIADNLNISLDNLYYLLSPLWGDDPEDSIRVVAGEDE